MINKADKKGGLGIVLWIIIIFLGTFILFALFKIIVLGSVAFWNELTNYPIIKFFTNIF